MPFLWLFCLLWVSFLLSSHSVLSIFFFSVTLSLNAVFLLWVFLSSWFSSILFLVFLGGLLVLSLYLVSFDKSLVFSAPSVTLFPFLILLSGFVYLDGFQEKSGLKYSVFLYSSSGAFALALSFILIFSVMFFMNFLLGSGVSSVRRVF